MADAALRDLFGLDGRTAVVVGASSGLGAESARALAAAGARLALIARRGDRIAAMAAELEATGTRALAVVGDATDRASLEAALNHADQELGHTWVLVYAAGVAPLGRAEVHSRAEWDRAIAVNLTGAFEACQIVGRKMIERHGGGRIIVISSVLGIGGDPVHRHVGYSATKGAVNQLVRQLAVEWAPHAITVNAIAPSYFPTEMTTDPATGLVPDAMRRRIERATPMGRLGAAGETRTAICFLAAPSSSYVTGTILPIDGGWAAW